MKLSVRRLLDRRATWIVLLTGLFLVSLVIRVNPYPDDPQQWSWHGRPPSPTTYPRWWPSLLVLTGYVLLGLWLERRYDRGTPGIRAWPALTLLIVLAPLIQVCLVYIHNPVPIVSYLYRTIGPHNGFWQIAIGSDDVSHLLRTYPQQMQAHPFVHTAVHPPGDVVYVWLWRRTFQALPKLAETVAHYLRFYNCNDLRFVNLNNDQIASALAQMIIPILSGLPVVPLYLFGKRLVGPRTGMRAATLYVVVPALTLFTMRWDQLYPLALCLALYWLYLGLEERRPGFYFLSGLGVSIASFMSFGNLTIFPALGLFGLFHLFSASIFNWRRWLERTWMGWGMLALGGASIWLTYQILFGNSFWDVFSTAMETHLHLGRDYWTWVLLNPYDFLTFLGVPVAVLFAVEGWHAWRHVLSSRGRDVPKRLIATLAVTGTMLAMNIAGVARGEVGRMWLLWMPLACLIGAVNLKRSDNTRLYRLTLALMALQALMFTLFLRVFATGMPAYSPPSPTFQKPTISHSMDVRFGEDISLLGYDLMSDQAMPGGKLSLTLYWQAIDRSYRPYTVFTHLIDDEGKLWGQKDNMPVHGASPTTCWAPGEYITDPYQIPVATDAPPGEYVLEVGLYWLKTGERLPVSGPDATLPDRVLLESVEIVRQRP